SGVGISYGAERIYDVLNELNLFPDAILNPVKVLFINFGKEDEKYALAGLRAIRKQGIAAEIYPDSVKIGKQMSYANAKAIPFVIMAGETERNSGTYTLKNMTSGEQSQLTIEDIIAKI
ncbi:MAG: His/Gly/Thr/Pro-type tRNA ligase C-terminal domain-containing protein, partial [Bacteroidales bacterium]|nr:His/Gly/Thr/Pro-type tRNA ligase C-terminal domain-containing protein [Bacteroidales bacterium]